MSRAVPLVLNIDDDEAGRYAVSRSMRQAGYEVMDADTGLKGLAAARAYLPDIILLDVRLPDIDGFEVCRRIREDPALAPIAVIHMSASYLDTSSRVKGLETGADAYLTEPVEPAVLVATAKSLLRFKHAETQVRESARQWQTTFDALSEGIALMDLSGSIQRSNAAFRNNAGAEAGGQRLVIARLLQSVVETGVRQSEEAAVNEACFSIAIEPVTNEAGDCTGAVCVIVDITEKRRFELQLQQTARLESLGVLAGGIAHDFNNLLTGILGNSSLMLESMPADAPEREMLDVVVAASESAADLTRQILTYAGKGHYQLEPLDLSATARQSIAFARRIVSKKVQLIDATSAVVPLVEADSGQMQQLMMNLIINASESFAENSVGAVSITTQAETLPPEFFTPGEINGAGEYVTVIVADNGSGMDEATQHRIFEPFFTTKFTGRGLGLSTVHGILQKHKAVLRLKSKLGAGTTFLLYFPASLAVKSELPREIESGQPEGGGAILVVDDEPAVRNVAGIALEKRGYRVLFADNGVAGVEMFRQHHASIRAVLMDFMMPLKDGEEALREMREISPDIPIVITSGYSRDTTVERFESDRVSGFLVKPFTSAQVTDAIAAVLKTAGPRQLVAEARPGN